MDALRPVHIYDILHSLLRHAFLMKAALSSIAQITTRIWNEMEITALGVCAVTGARTGN